VGGGVDGGTLSSMDSSACVGVALSAEWPVDCGTWRRRVALHQPFNNHGTTQLRIVLIDRPSTDHISSTLITHQLSLITDHISPFIVTGSSRQVQCVPTESGASHAADPRIHIIIPHQPHTGTIATSASRSTAHSSIPLPPNPTHTYHS
jgi:hypothetical protein